MSATDGWCDARGYDDRDMAIILAGGKAMPWKCELPYDHDGEHDMPNIRGMGLWEVGVRGTITWIEAGEGAKK